MNKLWMRYQGALLLLTESNTPETRRNVGIAYADFVSDYCPEHADQLIAVFAKLLSERENA